MTVHIQSLSDVLAFADGAITNHKMVVVSDALLFDERLTSHPIGGRLIDHLIFREQLAGASPIRRFLSDTLIFTETRSQAPLCQIHDTLTFTENLTTAIPVYTITDILSFSDGALLWKSTTAQLVTDSLDLEDHYSAIRSYIMVTD